MASLLKNQARRRPSDAAMGPEVAWLWPASHAEASAKQRHAKNKEITRSVNKVLDHDGECISLEHSSNATRKPIAIRQREDASLYRALLGEEDVRRLERRVLTLESGNFQFGMAEWSVAYY